MILRKSLDLNEQKNLELLIMDQIESFCKENQLHYFLTGGSLLGAVRHRGFIPWDDDIDISMPRKDYEIFIASFNNDNNKRYRVISSDNTQKYYLPFAKVIDTRTILRERGVKNGIDLGVYVDVFPIDYCGNDREEAWKFYCRRIKPLRKLLAAKDSGYDKLGDVHFFKKIRWMTLHFLMIFIPRKQIIRKINTTAMKCGDEKLSKLWGIITVMTYGKDEIMEKEWFDETISLEFEDRMYNAPKKYNEVLEHFYGDYMKLPPKEKRISHHLFDVYWKE